MTLDTTQPPQRLRRWSEGNPLSAAHLNEVVEAVRRLITPPVGAREVIPPGVADALQVRQFKVLSVEGDYLWCERQTGGPTNKGGEVPYRVAKPYLLRRTPFDGTAGRNGVTYVYDTDSSRTATITATSQTEDQAVIPSYETGDVLYAVRGITGGTGATYNDADGNPQPIDWLDMNADGRMWGQT